MHRALAYIRNGPSGLPQSATTEWRLVCIRWLGILFVLPSISLLGLPADRLTESYAVLAGAATYNLFVQHNLRVRPWLFANGYLTTVGDALLNVALISIGGGFATPLYFLLFTVTIASAMRYGYGPTAAAVLTFVSFDAAEHIWSSLGVDGPFLIRSGFLALTGLLASFLRDQAQKADAALQAQFRLAQHEALHDKLTGLPNRQLLARQLEEALADIAHTPGALALLFINLDHMQQINDTFGHHYGDMVLEQTARRLGALVPRSATVARHAGNGFAVVLPDADGKRAAATAANLLDAIQRPLGLDDIAVDVSARIGIALAPEHGLDADLLQRRADVASYVARTRHIDYALYSPEHDQHSRERLELASEMRRAIERGELYVVYQPIVSVSTGRMVEVEALVRWHHSTRGLISPADFVPIAEETGAILEIGRWVLEEACSQAARWRAAFPAARSLVMNVNVSARQLQQTDLVTEVRRVLERSELEPAALKLELTETVAMEDPELTIASLWNLKGIGVRIAIDDFGTGYSSLGYLKRFPADTLKIDKVFIDGLGVHPEDSAIVSAAIAFAHAVGLTTTAEGVESLDQLLHVGRLGADRVQGYFYSKPLRAEQLQEMLAAASLQSSEELDPAA
jgi:diguanylate cyclase (GGDEF)-like protein